MPVLKSAHKTSWNKPSQHVERQAHLGNTYTPDAFAAYMVRTFLMDDIKASLTDKHARWLEPAVGAGAFYFAVLDIVHELGGNPWHFALRFDAVDVDEKAIDVFRARVKDWFDTHQLEYGELACLPIHHVSLATFSPPGLGYRGIVANPPYLAPARWADAPEERASMLTAWQKTCPDVVDTRSDLYIYFFDWAHRHLATDGVSVFLCSDTWLDREFGQSLRDMLRDSNTYHLDTVAAWPWAALFRDDTCPIVTVVRHAGSRLSSSATSLRVFEGNPLTNQSIAYDHGLRPEYQRNVDLKDWFHPHTVHRRGWLTNGPLMTYLHQAMAVYRPMAVPLSSLVDVEGFVPTLNKLSGTKEFLAKPNSTGSKSQSDWIGNPSEWAKGVPIFYQAQARVGKPVDYSPAVDIDVLKCRIDAAYARNHLGGCLRTGGVWLSGAIDRMPLPMYTTALTPVLGVSKYFHLRPLDAVAALDGIAPLLAALLACTPVVLAMELQLQEGTRKTLRTDEQGYAKEITKSRLEGVLVPDVIAWGRPEMERVVACQIARQHVSLPRLDVAMVNALWKSVDEAIRTAMGVDAAQWAAWQALALALYWRRMRAVRHYGRVFKSLAEHTD